VGISTPPRRRIDCLWNRQKNFNSKESTLLDRVDFGILEWIVA